MKQQKEFSNLREIKHGSTAYQQTVELRYQVLRKPLGLKFSPEELAGESDSLHLACFVGEELAGCLVLNPLDKDTLRLRQMAVKQSLRNQGI